ncbi:glycoside hydrolase family 3 N-terminal domain-containing protein [Tsukamurella sp. 8F]|uniref:glycoside hydrolase family 3 N-terminal domain-containing protein n=1 Tax=unclassified Tsukamurella TaxID=2633480 RepID=UPI0023B951B5|nr:MULTISPECIES: glycoside hydrolase family 3 N-terminal domain-containing protein [unclassified Tsukamurella]MDF0532319.1 glycoside hydrolase family 3 N-terminal domain-containing protein [Tsukamurella sp. 8J]MDF0589421.1 glycoside hydrolase family 3 N-terminal domain-containing protein [Tsukamurella sp. 8F]
MSNLDRRTFLAAGAGAALTVLAAGRAAAAPASAGQKVVYSYPGLTPPAALLTKVSKGEVGGVIFFSDNISSASQLAAVAAEFRKAAPGPLALLTDQEGGQVNRVPGGPGASAKSVGASSDPAAAARSQGATAAATLRGAGLSGDLAPVLGVYRSAGDFLDSTGRSFSSDPKVVAECAAAFIRAAQGAGITACAKHFPGLGAAPAGANTDEAAVTIGLPAATLQSVDMAPYAAAIAAGVKMVMPSWAVYPSLDAANPAGMSRTILQGQLRGRLGFHGTIITDALEAGSLARYGSTGNRAVAAVRAGANLLCCSARDVAQGDEAAAALAHAGL